MEHLAAMTETLGYSLMTETLGHSLISEMARVRDELMPRYQSLGPSGDFALKTMRAELDRAGRALAEADVAAMIVAYADLKAWTPV